MFSQLKRALWKAVLLTTLVSLLGFTIALAAPGALDTTFSGDGRATIGFGAGRQEFGYDVELSGGKIVIAGETCDAAGAHCNFALARLTSAGALDTTFSGDGRQTTDFGADEHVGGVAVQPDGKVVVAGYQSTGTAEYMALARYTAAGNLDTTFSGDGKLLINFSGHAFARDVKVRSDGKIIVAGYSDNGSGYDVAAVRLNSNGSLDTSFSMDGKVTFGFGAGRSDVASVLALFAGKILLGGRTCDASGASCNFALARLTSAGALDTTFSGDGKQVTDFGANDHIRALAVQSDGKIIAAGDKGAGSVNYMAFARYTGSGSLDSTFSGDGKLVISLGEYAGVWGILVQSDGRIVAAGCGGPSSNNDFALVRLKPKGDLDPTFSGDGKALFDFAGRSDFAMSLVRQADGKYVLGGHANPGTGRDFAVIRVLP